MTIVVPVAIAAPSLPLPDPAGRATFSARKLEQLRWAKEDLAPGANALAISVYGNALDAQQSASGAYLNNLATSSNAQAAASYAGAAPWVTGTTYALGVVAWSPANRRLYRRLIAGAGSTDPSADPTNWGLINPGVPFEPVTTTTKTAIAGGAYSLQNVAASTVTLPASPSANDVVIVKPANGLATNIINPNGASIEGVAGNMTIDSATACVNLQYINSSWRLV